MFEFKMRDLQPGDVFTQDDGETWHTVQSVVTTGKDHVHVLCTDGYEDEDKGDTLVIVQ